MAGRTRPVRRKVFAILIIPVTALTVIWGFAATESVRQGLDYVRIGTVYEHITVPTRALISELQRERLMSLSYLGASATWHADLDGQQADTDLAAERLAAAAEAAQDVAPPAMYERVSEALRLLGQIDSLRGKVENREVTPLDGLTEYSAILNVAFQIFDRLMIATDVELITQTKAIILIGRGRELVSQQSALLTATIGTGRMTAAERSAFIDMVSRRRVLFELGIDQLDAELKAPFTKLMAAPSFVDFIAMENAVIGTVRPSQPLPVGAGQWQAVAETTSVTLDRIGGDDSRKLTERAAPEAAGVFWRIGLLGGLGLLAILIGVWISARLARGLTRELTTLQTSALDLADRRLPEVVSRLRSGAEVDVDAETPPLITTGTTSEIEKVAHAFTSVQQTAVQAAVGEAELRRGIGKVFLNLARRNQSLLHRQLTLLDTLEQQVSDPAILEQLFGVDHLTTRMRRHAEGLIILSGAAPGRGWRNPVNLYDVVRAAVEEVEDYLRVDVAVAREAALSGPVVTDVIHLVAELVENATIFSPPHTRVFVRGEVVARGFALEVEDRGLGIAHEELAQLNARLADPPEFDLADSDRLGLFVVGRLAQRNEIKVSLRASPYGGTTAIVLIPSAIVTEDTGQEFSVERVSVPSPTLAPMLTLPASGTSAKAAEPSGPFAAGASRAEPGRHAPTELPRRVRQANLAPQLRDEPQPPTDPGPANPNVFSSFQAGRRKAEEES